MYEIKVDPNKCIGCGICAIICPMEVYELRNGMPIPVNADKCVDGGICNDCCEQDAITISEVSLFNI